MNTRQMAKYSGHFTESKNDRSRIVACTHCSWRTSVSRQGRNALAATAKLCGLAYSHLREAHADKLG